MNKIVALVLTLCLFYVCVDSGFLDRIPICTLSRGCNQQVSPRQQPQTQPVRPAATPEDEEDEEGKRIIGTSTCAAGYRQDRQGNCRKIA